MFSQPHSVTSLLWMSCFPKAGKSFFSSLTVTVARSETPTALAFRLLFCSSFLRRMRWAWAIKQLSK